ncbi:hypothetical protein CK218_10810 [Mesorhizobium sp. WSM3879]|uniref:DUF6894 family protein n=1 Tax=Mesorhizobium sp. WSM3879 TaxID=2029406 RepID=UPI000BB0CB12|nr:hypothetical protein [Mesorhizobium sp. WSM3879]PBB80893.1 hypothetical protein CK218_10810 [Mesorhizobium sp. WSM3879]
MPRYLFEVVWDGQSLGDAWVELATIGAARKEALKALHDIAGEETAVVAQDRTLVVSVQDEAGLGVYSATLTLSQSP